MDSRQIQSRRMAIYAEMCELDKQHERLEHELADLQASCPHENKRESWFRRVWWECPDCDKELEHSESE